MTHRVLVINDDAYELSTLCGAMRLHGIEVVGEARNLQVAQNLIRSLRPDAILLDIQFKSEESLAFVNSTLKILPDVGFVLMTNCPDLRLLGLDLKDFPNGTKVVLKRSVADLSVIRDAIDDAILSQARCEKSVWMDQHLSLHENSFNSILTSFTNTQIETLRLLSKGFTNAEIGKIRYVSEKSVEQIVARIAMHLKVQHDRTMNLRVLLTGEYFKWLGAPRH